jgi:CelD/BcsL family acetyltransferase involved in cellulose biosynthesis
VSLRSITPELATEWDELASAAGASPFVRPGWVEAWSASFGSGEPRLLTVSSGGSLVAAMPLVVGRLGYRSPTNWHTAEFGSVSSDDDAATSLFDALLRSPVPTIDLGHLGSDDLRRFEDAGTSPGRRRLTWVQQDSPFVDTTVAWDAYVTERDRRWLRQLEKRREQLKRQGDLTLELHEAPTNLDALLEEGFGLEAAGWKGENGTAVLSNARTRRFYWDVARWAAGRRLLRLAFLRLDGQAIAFDYALEDDQRHYFLKTGFDQSLKPQAPGLILRHDMIRRAFDLGLRSYELLGGAESYKLTWTNETRPRHRALAFDRSLIGQAAWAAYRYGRPALKRVRARLRSSAT